MNVYHALFSSKAAEQHGYAIYERADGSQVCVTSIGMDKEKLLEDYGWPDKKYVGEVVKFISSNIKIVRTVKGLTETSRYLIVFPQ
jgi:hypothetical protein